MDVANSPPSRVMRFGAFIVDLRLGQVHKHGVRLQVQEQPFQVLAMLLERPGDLVSRKELHQRLWPADTFVDFDHGLNAAINRLRECLADDAERPRYIETIPRRGYRFIATVEQDLTAPPTPVTAELPAPPVSSSKRAVWIARWPFAVMLAGLLCAAIAFGWNVLRSRQRRPPIRSIAVLPLINLSGDPEQEYFAVGMTDELITDLARIRSLRVVSHTSVMQFKNSKKSLPEIARELNVDGIVEGSVLRSANKIKVNVQLLHGPTDQHLWAESFQRNSQDVIQLQDELARVIVEQIRLKLTPQEEASFHKTRPVNPGAHDAYVHGRYYWFQARRRGVTEAFPKSRQYFEQAIDLDPSYALAYSGLSDYYGVATGIYGLIPAGEGWPRAEALARKALELDDSLAEAHNSLAADKFFYERDWVGAEKEFRRGIAVNSDYSEIHALYSYFLASMKRFEESVAEAKRAEAIDPIIHEETVFVALLWAHQFDEVTERCQKMLGPEPAKAHYWLAQMYFSKGMYEEWFQEDQKRLRLTHQIERVDARERAHSKGGLRAVYQWDLERMKRVAAQEHLGPARIAAGYTVLGDRNRALQWLEKDLQMRDGEIVYVNIESEFESLHSDPRFKDLIRRIGLPN